MINGACLCGAVNFSIDIPESDIINSGVACHCPSCKTASSTASFNVNLPVDKLSVTKGKPAEFTDTGASGKPVHRFFCKGCGTPLYTNAESMPDVSFVKVGSLKDVGNRVKLTAEAWVGNANPGTVRSNVQHLDENFQATTV